MTGFPPSLFIIGAQKAGTTFLADALGQHPSIVLANPKEPGYLAGNHQKGIDWYRSCFTDDVDKVFLDASTSYTMAPTVHDNELDAYSRPLAGVPERLKQLSPAAKLIYVLRDPVVRTYSAYWHNVRAGHEDKAFRAAIESRSLYLRTSDYMYQLQKYLNHFNDDAIHIMVFEELIANPALELKRCCEFIGVDADFCPNLEQKNRGYTYRGGMQRVNMAMSRFGGITPLAKAVSRLVPNVLKHALGAMLTSKVPPMTVADKEFLQAHFQEMVAELEGYMGREIPAWSGFH